MTAKEVVIHIGTAFGILWVSAGLALGVARVVEVFYH